MHFGQLDVSTYVIVKAGCPLQIKVIGSGQVEITYGEPRDGCQTLMEAEPFRAFLRAGAEALREMDARFDRECREAGVDPLPRRRGEIRAVGDA
jgi:hypothetical protein